jgi:fructokinase
MIGHRPCVVGLGELVWDLLPDGDLPGGAPANFAFHAAQLGGEGVVVSAVGKDPAGMALCDWLHAAGVDHDSVQSIDRATGKVSVSLSSSGQPEFVIHENAAWDYLAWNKPLEALAARTDCVCVGSLAQRSPLSRKIIRRFLLATSPGCLRIFDVNLRPPYVSPRVIAETVKLANIVKLNEDEWPFVAEHLHLSNEWSAGLREMVDKYQLRLVALTRGAGGSVLVDKDGIHEAPSQQVQVVDTIGAGDAFAAAMAIGLLHSVPISRLHRNAAAVARFVCTQPGATPVLPGALVHEVISAESKPPESAKLLLTQFPKVFGTLCRGSPASAIS